MQQAYKTQKIVFETYDKTITGISMVERFEDAEGYILRQIESNGNTAHVEYNKEGIIFVAEINKDNVIVGFHYAFNEKGYKVPEGFV